MLRRTFLKKSLLLKLAIAAAGLTGCRVYDTWQSAQPVTTMLPMMDELTDVLCFLAQETSMVCLGDTAHFNNIQTVLLSDPSRLDKMEAAGFSSILIESDHALRPNYTALQEGRIQKDSPAYQKLIDSRITIWNQPYIGRYQGKCFIDAINNRKLPAIVPTDFRPRDRKELFGLVGGTLTEMGDFVQSMILPETLPRVFPWLPGLMVKAYTDSIYRFILRAPNSQSFLFNRDAEAAQEIIDHYLGAGRKNLMLYGARHFEIESNEAFLPCFRRAGLKPLWVNYYPEPELGHILNGEKRFTQDVCFIANPQSAFWRSAHLPQLTFKDQGMKARYQAYFTDRPEMLALVEPQAKPPEKKAALSRRAFLTRTFS